MSLLVPLIAVLLIVAAVFGAAAIGLQAVPLVVVPYLAVLLLLAGLVRRVLLWGRSPVPFRTPTTAGQQRSLSWIRSARLDNPATGVAAAARVLLEVIAFRSLFRNTRATLRPDGRLVYSADKRLWAGALAFHLSFLFILLRHLRFFFEPVPRVVGWLGALDGFFKVGLPEIYATDVVVIVALGYLLLRRLGSARLRYISLAADYFPLFVLLGIASTGVLVRYFVRTDLVAVKQLTLGLVTLHPVIPAGIGPLATAHLLLVSVLFAYLPFSKLTHLAGVFLSPTRNLANTNRVARHVNPWDHPVDVHTYAEWEEEFHDKLVAAGIPLDGE
jgi:[DsrC]-trisulfide reductase subunit M